MSVDEIIAMAQNNNNKNIIHKKITSNVLMPPPLNSVRMDAIQISNSELIQP
jgi:hypothetical protein